MRPRTLERSLLDLVWACADKSWTTFASEDETAGTLQSVMTELPYSKTSCFALLYFTRWSHGAFPQI